MLSISHLNAWFPTQDGTNNPNQEIQVLSDICLSIKQGQTVALVGESGSGKSVIALSILRLLDESTTIRTEGSIVFENHNLLTIPPPQLRKIRGNRISMIFQEPMTSLNPVYTVGHQLIEPLRLHQDLKKEEAEAEAISLLEKTGIEDPQKRFHVYPHQLSGGQRQRVMIAMALACRPSLLIADEPTTALDVSIQAQILLLIKKIQREYNMAMLLISHDLNVVQSIADYIYIIRNGKIIEAGNKETIFFSPSNEYTRNLTASLPPKSSEITADENEKLLIVDKLSCSFILSSGLQSLFRRNNKTVKALTDISFSIKRGSTCGIIGESGSGKTTLGLAILRLVKSAGTIDFNKVDLQRLPAAQLRRLRSRFQIVFQDPYSSLSPRLTVGEIIEEGLIIHRKDLNRNQRGELVRKTLNEVGLPGNVVSRFPHEFSGGQRQRIAIARVIILNPEMLILDEPTSALDMTIQSQILDLLKDLQKKLELTYLFISHDLKVIRAISDTIIVMQKGKIVESGRADIVFNNPREPYTRRLFKAALDITS